MTDYLPKEVRDGLELARKAELYKNARLRVLVDDTLYPIRRMWEGGFSLDVEDVPHLRGLVDIYDGSRHMYQCLIVASSEDTGEMIFEFKRHTAVQDKVPLDFYRDENAPIALIGR